MKIQPGRNPYGFVLVQSAQHLQKNVIPSLWQCSTVTLQKWWMSILGNAMARNMKTRPGRNPYELRLVQSAQNLQKNDSYAFNSERNFFSTSSQWPLAYVLLLLAVFWVSFGQFSLWKIDFSIFFQPQGGRHISLFSWAGPDGYPRVLDYSAFEFTTLPYSKNVTTRSSSRVLTIFTFLSFWF